MGSILCKPTGLFTQHWHSVGQRRRRWPILCQCWMTFCRCMTPSNTHGPEICFLQARQHNSAYCHVLYRYRYNITHYLTGAVFESGIDEGHNGGFQADLIAVVSNRTVKVVNQSLPEKERKQAALYHYIYTASKAITLSQQISEYLVMSISKY